ncbi:gag/pol/env polyprotein, putative [Perkinsus marinus ATCC 50983]|uniref:Gag/pol/env polyprotein, putative n=1 Tax=Perkinsus marinus (strain ATCC 50983 / TXsc) TaxID=423536 RepID=C5LL07_PERM5|nr:gag/pol/env polyprotein, putative [Perkinsus marinus ATCC 50983]EER02571.1 gag/pol/env polyprotein, putative [Perkinsus marinus ATCC 50983]|eukprot:XP_002769853.1 gag/pol/env polyprotein, putative [Perkinsus marinus ATCC 50983]
MQMSIIGAGVAIHVIQVPIDFSQRANLSEFRISFDDLTKLCRQENIVLERDGYKILCLPAVFDGGSFHSNSFPGSSLAMTRSSTFRERAAQILFANRNSGILAGLVYGVTDNVNTTREWQSAITDFCGAWHSLYSNYISNVEKILWLPRTSSTVALIDHLARECGSQVSKDSVTETKHVDLRIATPEDVGDDDSTSSDTDSEDHPQAWSNDVKAYLDLSTLRTVSSTDPEALNLCKKPGYFWSNGTPGLLLRRIRHDLGGRVVLQVFIPKEFREALVKEVHLESSHGKSPNVASRLSSFCWFPAMKRFAAQVIRRCDSCQLVDPDGQQLPPPGSRKVDAKSWFEVGIDLIGPVRASSGSDSSSITASLLTATCAYTSFTAVFPLAGSFKAQNICDGLSVIFNRFGYPVRLRCDRAQAHLSKYMTEYCRLHGLQIKYSASRAPWTLGWVETRHRVINSTLARMLEGSGRSWDDPVVIAMLENCINSYGLDYEGAENVSPYELMFGFTPCSALQARLRIEQLDSDFDDIETDDPTELTSMARNRALRLDRLQQRFISIWQDRRERAFETALNKSSKHRSDRPISIGDRVLALGRREHKWSRRFRGPFKVTRIIGKRIAVLVHESTNVVEEHHIKNLKLFREDDDIPDEGVLDVDDDSRMDGLVSDDPEDLIHDKTVPDDDSRVAQDGSNNFPPQPRPQRAAKERALQALRAHDWNGDDDDT